MSMRWRVAVLAMALSVTACGSPGPVRNNGLVPWNVYSLHLQRFVYDARAHRPIPTMQITLGEGQEMSRIVSDLNALPPTTGVCPRKGSYVQLDASFSPAHQPISMRIYDCGVVYAGSGGNLRFRRSARLGRAVTRMLLVTNCAIGHLAGCIFGDS